MGKRDADATPKVECDFVVGELLLSIKVIATLVCSHFIVRFS